MSRTVQFAGAEWLVKAGGGLGPGPNEWSDDSRSVWVDGEGLHLRIRRAGDRWCCAEVHAAAPSRHGAHRLRIASPLDGLDRNAVLGLFLYRDDDREIDIEFARWGDPAAANAQYVVQPALPGRIHRFPWTHRGPSVHEIRWGPASAAFESFRAELGTPAARTPPEEEWTFSGDSVPQDADGLRLHLNLWLFRGRPPADGREAEVVIAGIDLPDS